MEKSKIVPVRMPTSLYDKLKEAAKEENRPVSYLIRRATIMMLEVRDGIQ